MLQNISPNNIIILLLSIRIKNYSCVAACGCSAVQCLWCTSDIKPHVFMHSAASILFGILPNAKAEFVIAPCHHNLGEYMNFKSVAWLLSGEPIIVHQLNQTNHGSSCVYLASMTGCLDISFKPMWKKM